SALEGFAPIQCIGPTPWILRLVKPIASLDEVVGRDQVVGGIRHNAAPTILASLVFHRSRQPQLQSVSPVSVHDANAAEIACVVSTRRRNHPGESDRQPVMIYNPPMALVEFRNGRGFKECQPMEVSECIGHFVV